MQKIILLTIAIVTTLLTSACGGLGCCFGNGWGMMNFGHGGMFMWMILLLVIIALAIYYFTKVAGSKENLKPKGETPIEILKRRYAKGEITKDQFESMKKDMEE